jgi:hypothetical protein
MKTLGTIVVAVTVALCFLMVWNDPALVERRQTAADYERMREADRLQAERLQAERREQERDWQQQVDQFAIPLTRVVTTAVTIALLVAVPASVALVLVGVTVFMRRRSGLIYPDAAGRVPLQLDSQVYQQIAAVALQAYHQTEQERARQSYSVPANYAPHITYAPQYRAQSPLQAATGPLQAAPGPEVVTFASLLSQGRIGKGNPLLLGIDEQGQPIEGSWLDLFSVGIGGLTGSGKSWTGCALLSQAMLHGARIAILDPHAGDEESLSARLTPLERGYLCEVASSGRDMLATVRLVADELERRTGTKSASREPWVIVADEFSSLMRGGLAEPLAGLFEAIAQEGRKMQVYGMALGQAWTASRSGGSELRDSLASAYLHRLRPAQARYLSGLTAADLPRDLLELPAGTAYLLSTRGELRRVSIPRMTNQDMQQIAMRMPVGRQQDAIPEVASTASQCGKQLEPEQARAVGLFQGGMEVKDVVRTMYGNLHSGSREYRERRSQVEAWIREVGR